MMLASLSRYVEYVMGCFRMSIFRSLEYRAGLITQYVLDMIWYVVQFALLRTAYNFVPVIGGYSLEDAYVFMGVLFLVDAFTMMLFNGGIEYFTRSIRRGTLDFYLLRPMPALYQILFMRVSLSSVFNFVFVVFFWIYLFATFEMSYSLDRWLWFSAEFVLGMWVNCSLRLIVGCAAFWSTESGSLNWLFHELMRFGTKPENVYTPQMRRFLTTFLPVLLLSAWPTFILIRETSLEEKLLPFGISAILAVILWIVWKAGVRRYEGMSFGGSSS